MHPVEWAGGLAEVLLGPSWERDQLPWDEEGLDCPSQRIYPLLVEVLVSHHPEPPHCWQGLVSFLVLFHIFRALSL